MSSSLYEGEEHEYNAVVVDRERDVSLVTRLLYSLEYHRRSLSGSVSDRSYRLTLGFAPHLFGSGKTTFIKNFLSLVRRFGDSCLRDSSSNPLARSFLEKLKNAAFLYVDLSKLEPTSPVEEKRNLEWAVYYLMYRTACLEMGVQLLSKKEVYELVDMEPLNLVPLLRRILNMPPDQFLLVGFDEVGVLEEIVELFDLEVGADGRSRPYSHFFGIVRELCEQPGLFVIMVGKCKGLRIQNYVSSVSRVLLEFIALSPLEKNSIVEYLEKSSSNSLPGNPKVSEILCNEHFSVTQLAELLLEFTGGVPGLLVRAINVLLQCAKSEPHFSLSKERFLSIMNYPNIPSLCIAPFLPRLETFSVKRQRIMELLVLFALYRIRFEILEEVEVGESHSIPLFDLVTDMCFYRRECVDEDNVIRYEVCIPKLLVEHIKGQFGDKSLDKLLLQTLGSQPVESFFYSKCRVLEGLVATKLYLFFSRHPSNNSLLSTLAQLSSVWNGMNLHFSSQSAAYYMKSIHYTPVTSATEWTTFGNNEWERIVADILEYEKIYVPEQPTSHGPDILFKLRGRTSEDTLIVGIACKGRWSSSGIRWADIVEEARTFLNPVHDQVLTGHSTLHCMLIILSTKLATNVSNDLSHSSRCYSSGKIVPGGFVVPHNCELVIFSKKDVEDFIGKEILASLREAFESTDNPHAEEIGITNLQKLVSSLDKIC